MADEPTPTGPPNPANSTGPPNPANSTGPPNPAGSPNSPSDGATDRFTDQGADSAADPVSHGVTDLAVAVAADELLSGTVTGTMPAQFRGPVDCDTALFHNVDLAAARIEHGQLNAPQFRGGSAANALFERSRIIDARFDNVDLTGIGFSTGTVLRRVVFVGCKLAYSTWFGATLDEVTFDNCVMREARFNTVEMIEVEFSESDLTATGFDHITVAEPGGLDVRGCTIDETKGLAAVRNLRIDAGQAAMISQALLDRQGIIVGDDE